MATLLIAIIYIVFISLGLPDALLGSALPAMRGELGVPIWGGGLLAAISSVNTIIAALLSSRISRKIGFGLNSVLGLALLAVGAFGLSFATSFWMLCLLTIPFGFGGGTLDSAVNNYVSKHFAARHMNWLHACWGLGASISPYIVSYFLVGGIGWQGAYRTVALLQIVVTFGVFLSLPLWKSKESSGEIKRDRILSLKKVLQIKGVKFVLPAFFCYCALESTAIVWAVSYLHEILEIEYAIAARFASLFLIGMTSGRIISGFITKKIGSWRMLKIGSGLILAGILANILPLGIAELSLYGLVVLGLGCAPIYPSIMSLTPKNFGKENSRSIIGVQMAAAYSGTALAAPLFGLLAEFFGLGIFPYFQLTFGILMFALFIVLRKAVKSAT